MNKLNEVAYCLYNLGWFMERSDTRYSDNEDEIIFTNYKLEQFEIDILVDKKTQEVKQVGITMLLDNKLSEVYRRSDLECFLEDVKLVQKALDKLEFEIVRPMCEKFDIPFVNEESYGGERYYLDVEGIEERLEQWPI